ncbi:MAG: lytic murein transglycosylase [Proteobacteria bacterium]|nr:lytic murein transglycosylase [Pseudomonadota bacterium]MBU4471268.1 lytic murein transglycosylase [Pseudomonadota bacterium]MCG2753549.1 lytic murein transglycosylase [Desulfobacteraceae bacterium]
MAFMKFNPLVLWLFTLLFLIPHFSLFSDEPQNTGDPRLLFNHLEKKLITDGFDEQQIQLVFAHKNIAFADSIVSRYFMHLESKLNYGQFLKPENLQKARNYMEAHAKDLDTVESAYGVDKTVIVAILMVETRLGTYLGKSSIFNTLATMASLDHSENREVLWQDNLKNLNLARNDYEKKALKKAGWAYSELKALLTFAMREGVDPVDIIGSYAGAMGISQFMPSNALTLAVDGDGNGSVDLFTHGDAIASVANYLKKHGWKPGMNRDGKFKAVYHYNHSKYYVNTVLDMAKALKGS